MNLVTHLKAVLLDLHASWVMWLLLALSVVSLLLIAERALFFRGLRDDIRALADDLDALLRAGQYREALARLAASPAPEAAAVVAGLKHADLGPASAEKAMQGAVALQRMRLDRGLAFLGTLGNNAPFVGLLGTVIGVIEAFDVLSQGPADATKVNLDASQDADVALMAQRGWTKLYRGTATHAGTGSYTQVDGGADTQAKFAALSQTLHFVFGFNGAAQNLNGLDPDFGDGDDPSFRGVQPTPSGEVIAQITLHVDHVFRDVLEQEGAPLRFDPIAAWAPTDGGTLDLTMLSGKPLAATFADGAPLPDRGPVISGAAGFTSDQADPSQVVLDTNGVTTVDDLAKFMVFAAQSQMHLNADGECDIKGQQASDPYFQPQIP